ncbi:hypothetical protein F4814DRAFT_377040 [Daldinia grandis]|nr:hypothetical protein F4814DRAFT_377040 [Daldinia grandis]
MTSQPLIDFSSLPDLRDMHPGDAAAQDIFLQRQEISRFIPSPDSSNIGNLSGIDAFVCILRHLYSQMAIHWRGDPKMTEPDLLQEIRKAEADNPLLRFAWSDIGQSRENVLAQSRVREAIVARLTNEDSQLIDLSFLGLAESDLMRRTLFCRPPFQLYDPNPLSQPIPTDQPGEWDIEKEADAAERAKRSLITWNGQGNLGEFISDRFDISKSARNSRRYLYTSNKPLVIRVLYNAPAENAPGFSNLRLITVQGSCLTHIEGTESTVKIEKPENNFTRYTLIAVANLRSAGGDRDLVRRYSLDGRECWSPLGFEYGHGSWKLEKPGQYMLFYVPAPAKPSLVEPPEITDRPNDFDAKIALARNIVGFNAS